MDPAFAWITKSTDVIAIKTKFTGVIKTMQTLLFSIFFFIFSSTAYSQALIDKDVLDIIQHHDKKTAQSESIGIIIFMKSNDEVALFLNDINKVTGVIAHPLHFMPAVVAVIPKNIALVRKLANYRMVAQISANNAGSEELEVSAQSLLLSPSPAYPDVSNWWQQGYTGRDGVVGLIDSGVAIEHPGLLNKNFIVRQEPDSEYSKYQSGVRSAHATGAACIYAGIGSGAFPNELGMAYGVSTILTGLAGEGDGEMADLLLTATTLDWMLTRTEIKPTIINYSFGNGLIGCKNCMDWSGLAKVVDYVVNHEKILWVKSAGNKGFIAPQNKTPYTSTMTSPADNYNALTVANMNPTMVFEDGTSLQMPYRDQHAIRYTSSRGPTLNGRRKPDITAPGNDTRTCAPDPRAYKLNYSTSMDFHDGYRLMGGTSSAAPHVGGAVLLLFDAGIKNPIAAKALLLNSADAWTDSGKPGPDDPEHPYTGGHFPVMGSEWNPTYGWGYMNMQHAFDQRFNIIENQLTVNTSVKEYEVFLPVAGKVTLVHERRVGYRADNTEWQLSHLSLELVDADTNQVIAQDNSAIDTVHQVANCLRKPGEQHCASETKPLHAIVRVKLLSPTIDGSYNEPFALSYG